MLYYFLGRNYLMFFIGIFGIDNKEKEVRDIQNKVCKSCGNMTSFKLIKSYSFFHFFFIPLFKWNIKYFLISRCCNSVFSIPNELGKELEGGRDATIREEAMTPINNFYGYDTIVCPSCKSIVEPRFSYCPYCGRRVK